jgi:hypothetical protein
MELDLQSFFGLHVHSLYTHCGDPATPSPPHLGLYTRALLVSQDRRHLFVTPCIDITAGHAQSASDSTAYEQVFFINGEK